MRAPRLLVLGDRGQAAQAGRDLPSTLERAARAGAPAVVLRERDLPAGARAELAAQCIAGVRPHGCRLLVAGDAELAGRVGADGVHLAGTDPPPARSAGLLLGRSCHDPAGLAAARCEGLDYATASPVAATASKPGYGPALGVAGLARCVAAAGDLPVLALGGVDPANAPAWVGAGAHGVAVMGAVMRAGEPDRVVHELAAAVGEEAR